jgi:hypothetical protein
MGFALLWFENLAVSLLLMALVFACVGRLRWRWLRHALWMPPCLLLLLPSACGVLVWWSMMSQPQGWVVKWFFATLALAVSFVMGSLWLRIRGLRRVDGGSAPTVAGGWSRGKLAIACGVVMALHLMTFWNLDLAARQQAEMLRGEAGALALSVAPPRVPDRDNATPIYERAFAACRGAASREKLPPEKWTQWQDPSQPDLDVSDPDLRKHLQNYAPALALLHRAVAKSGCYFEHDYAWPTFTTLLPEVQTMHLLANLSALDARVQAAGGNIRAALQDINTMFAISQHISEEPWLVCLLASVSVDQTAVATLQEMLAGHSVSADDLAVLNVENRRSHQKLLERSLRGEEASRLTLFCQIGSGEMGVLQFRDEITRLAVAASSSKENPVYESAVSFLYRVFLFAGDLADHRRLSKQLYEIAAKPYYEAKPLIKDFEEHFHHGYAGLITGMTMPAVVTSYAAAVRADALQRALQIGLAAEQYRVRHGKFPAELADLAPDFIPVIPTDPFDGKPMKMKPTEHGLILYSIGPDMVDDGGSPLKWKWTPPGTTATTSETPTGDITFELSDREP